MPFKFLGATIAQGLMQALPIIEALEILEDGLPGLGVILKRALMRQLLIIEGTEKNFLPPHCHNHCPSDSPEGRDTVV